MGSSLTGGFPNSFVLDTFVGSSAIVIELNGLVGLDHAFEALFQHTQFHEVSYALFVKLAGGELTQEEEQMLEALGVVS